MRTLLLVGLLCVNFLADARKQQHRSSENGEKSYRKEWNYQNAKVFKHASSIAHADHGFLFVLCSDGGLPSSMSCDVKLDVPVDAWNSSKSSKSSCKLNLSADLGHELTGIVSVERFLGLSGAIVVWWQRLKDSQYQVHKIGLSLVSLPTCHTRQLDYPVDVEKRVVLSNVIVYPHGFDVIVTNEDTCRPANATTCRISHDQDGQRVGTPAAFPLANFDRVTSLAASPDSPKNGFYVYGTDVVSWKFRSMLVGADGALVPLMSAHGVSDPRQLLHATSNANGLYGVCVLGDGRFHCAQLDDRAGVRMDTDVVVESAQWAALYNVAEDEALLAYGACNGNNKNCKEVRVARVRDGEGSPARVWRLDLKCHDVPGRLAVEIGETGGDFCFYFACSHEVSGGGDQAAVRSVVKYNVRCMPKSQFA
ncbi:uncharacterized protein LOC106647162 [Copidosoma floridanum]|uniref:uncharacterized protein LOC106647162 n=1 Tax=Copidosoma floridanum TaxID=29053 RepID=UPI0006C994DC|nr:uncharacterized protein LOC106647162 [Copidosoma floridanum]